MLTVDDRQARLDAVSDQLEKLECKHERSEIRYRLASNGGKMFKHQCLRCGELVGKWIPHAEVENKDAITEIDDEFKRFNIVLKMELRSELLKLQAEINKNDFFKDYSVYLQSDEWRQKRQLVFSRCDNMCEGCGTRYAAEVHHLTYAHYKNEFLFELVGLCKECHHRIHQTKD